jgi:hypothetical protein
MWCWNPSTPDKWKLWIILHLFYLGCANYRNKTWIWDDWWVFRCLYINESNICTKKTQMCSVYAVPQTQVQEQWNRSGVLNMEPLTFALFLPWTHPLVCIQHPVMLKSSSRNELLRVWRDVPLKWTYGLEGTYTIYAMDHRHQNNTAFTTQIYFIIV